MNISSIGKNIRECRITKGMKQEELAEKTDLSSVYIGMLERGEKTASLETLVKIANALEVSSDILLKEVLVTGYRSRIPCYRKSWIPFVKKTEIRFMQ